MAPDLIVQALEDMRRELYELRVKVERMLADNEARETVCRITHDAVNARLKRHSDGFKAVRDEQNSIHEEIDENTKTDIKAPQPQVAVARWAAISAIAVSLITGGALMALAKVVVKALAHAMGITGG